MKQIAGLAVLFIGSILSIFIVYTNVDLNTQEIINYPINSHNTFSTKNAGLSRMIDFRGSLSSKSRRQKYGLKIMLVGRMRTGSTFIGEILNQNNDLFYLFEPLQSIDVQQRKGLISKSDKTFSGESFKLLRKISMCDFTLPFVQGIAIWPLARSKSKNVSPICKKTLKCKQADPVLFNKACKKLGANLAMKFIRSDIEVLQSLVEDEHQNVKIIHLVRDPRGTANSRRSYYGKKHQKVKGFLPSLNEMGLLEENPSRRMNTIPKLCKWMRKTLSYAIKQPKWLQGRYKILRYEDFSVNPLETTNKIYEFLGVPLPENVKQWLINNTNAENVKKPSTFSTLRNSTYTATSWRSSLSLKDVLLVQHLCGDVMAELGYIKMYNDSDLQNFSVPVFTSFEFGDFIL
ncbi:carbohydrate sulfotransferase 1-like [Antedon mediterranea]|uniref:carbohydrate sulfotransferase 1-like n=1 Tax=Antedon mediterranea TaxID=105859 RepID=UPI003AF5815A